MKPKKPWKKPTLRVLTKLPNGLVLGPGWTLIGKPTKAGTTHFTVEVLG